MIPTIELPQEGRTGLFNILVGSAGLYDELRKRSA